MWIYIQVERKKGSKIKRRIIGKEEEGDRVKGKTEKTKEVWELKRGGKKGEKFEAGL